jgi:hypothetical protein
MDSGMEFRRDQLVAGVLVPLQAHPWCARTVVVGDALLGHASPTPLTLVTDLTETPWVGGTRAGRSPAPELTTPEAEAAMALATLPTLGMGSVDWFVRLPSGMYCFEHEAQAWGPARFAWQRFWPSWSVSHVPATGLVDLPIPEADRPDAVATPMWHAFRPSVQRAR